MRICFVSQGSVQAFHRQAGEFFSDLTVLGFQGGGEVDYQKELNGQTTVFEEIANLSKTGKNVVVCGCVTDACGIRRNSVVVAEKGKILGVSDMTHSIDGASNSGAFLRTYDTALGKMGVVVGEDLYFPETVRTLVDCGSDYVVCPFKKVMSDTESVLLRAAAFNFGVPLFFCSVGNAMIADPSCALAFSSCVSPVTTEYRPKKQYHLVETRRRGFFCPSQES